MMISSITICLIFLHIPSVIAFHSPSSCRAGSIRIHMNVQEPQCSQKIYDEHVKIWESRRSMINGTLKTAEFIKSVRSKLPESKEGAGAGRNAVLLTAFSVAAATAFIRIGGRAAFLGILGLDVSEDSGIKESIEKGLLLVENAGVYKYVLFGSGWIISKNLCIDFLSVILALISGIIFGGVIEGALASVICATLSSIIGFQLARTQLRDKVEEQVQRRPALRAIDRAVSKEGFKTVITLRLAPLLPIPLGAYNYIYGITSLSLVDFSAGMFLGSIKPYLLDSYLGVFGKSIIDSSTTDNGDIVLLGTFALAVLIGAFASELAGRTWDEMQVEMNQDTANEKDRGKLKWNDFMGINQSELPGFIQSLNIKTSAAEELCWKVVVEEHDKNFGKKSSSVDKFSKPPCPPPLLPDGKVDYSVYFAESLVFNNILFRAITEFSNPLTENNGKIS